MPTPILSFRTCGGLEAFTPTIFLKNVVEKLDREGRRPTS